MARSGQAGTGAEAAGPLAAGTVAAQRLTVSGVRDGQPLLTFRATWYCIPDLDPAWDTRVCGWHLTVDGDAPLDIGIRFPVPLDQMASVFPAYTANRAVNAVPYVCAEPPGIHTHRRPPADRRPPHLTRPPSPRAGGLSGVRYRWTRRSARVN